MVELLVATLLTMIVVAGLAAVVAPARAASASRFELMDMEQRTRVAADTIAAQLTKAGAGLAAGAERGPLFYSLAPILPLRQRTTGGDAPGTFRSDAITVLFVPPAAAEATLSSSIGPGALTLQTTPSSGCPITKVLCGWTTGTTLLVLGGFGRYDLFTLIGISGTSGLLRAEVSGGALLNTHPAGSTVVEVVQRSYLLKTDARGVPQLVMQDGPSGADVPVVDHVVGLRFDYRGEPRPATLLKAITDPAPPWTRYGPKPPPPTSAPTAYPPGENCLFTLDAASGAYAPRLPDLGSVSALVPLTASELGDRFPMCPDGVSPSRFDADLLRIRSVAVTLRIESALDGLRGPASVLFTRGGTSRDVARWLPDREVHIDVSPRNLSPGS